MKLYSALYQTHDPFCLFDDVIPCHNETPLDKDGVLLLHGGADISPSIYGEKASKFTGAKDKKSDRDERELRFIDKALKLGIPIVGICRGAQLLCAVAGGKLVQDVSGHEYGNHFIQVEEGNTLHTNSIHHQMMIPNGTNHKLIAWCDPKLSDYYIGEHSNNLSIDVEPEIVFFKDLNALAIQGHPEYLSPTTSFVRYCSSKIKEYLNVVA